MIITLTCPNCGETISIVHGRLYHNRPKKGKNEVRNDKKRKSFKEKGKESAKAKG